MIALAVVLFFHPEIRRLQGFSLSFLVLLLCLALRATICLYTMNATFTYTSAAYSWSKAGERQLGNNCAPGGCLGHCLGGGHVSLAGKRAVPVRSCTFHIRFSVAVFVVCPLCPCSSWAAVALRWLLLTAGFRQCSFSSGVLHLERSAARAAVGSDLFIRYKFWWVDSGHCVPSARPLLGRVTLRNSSDLCSVLGWPYCHCLQSLGVSGLLRGCSDVN